MILTIETANSQCKIVWERYVSIKRPSCKKLMQNKAPDPYKTTDNSSKLQEEYSL